MADFEPGAAAPVENVEPAAPAVEPVQSTDAPEPTAGQESEPTPEAKPERTFTQAELNKIVQKEKAQESRRAEKLAEARLRAEYAERQLNEYRQASQPKQPEGEPRLEDFKTYEEYIKAGIAYGVKQAREQDRAESQRTYQQQTAHQQATQMAQAVAPKIERGVSKYPDFEEVAMSFEAPPAMQEAMVDSDITDELFYHLGSNPAERSRIASLSPMKQVREILALEAKLKAPPSLTKTPAPITPSPSAGATTKSTSEMTDAEWVKWRESDLKQKRAR